MSVDDGLRALLRKHLPKVHWTSIETGLTQRGVPDLNGCAEGRDFWVECKSVKRGWAVTLRPEQISWLLTRTRYGGRTFVAVRRRVLGVDDLILCHGRYAADLRENGLTCKIAVAGWWSGGPARWNWDDVRTWLVG